MNVKIITIVIFVLIVITGFGMFFMNEQNTKQLAQRISPTTTDAMRSDFVSAFPGAKTVTTNDGRVSFHFPESWSLQETTVPGGGGQFGPIVQSWILQSFPRTQAGNDGIPTDSAKIDIEIQKGGQNLSIEDLIDCGMKTTSCEKIGIDNEQFIRSEQTLNTGMKAISIATFYDDKILRMNALIATGEQQATLSQTVNDIFATIRFSALPRSEN